MEPSHQIVPNGLQVLLQGVLASPGEPSGVRGRVHGLQVPDAHMRIDLRAVEAPCAALSAAEGLAGGCGA